MLLIFMNYKVVKYKPKKKRRVRFETYEPKKRVEFSRGRAVPLLVRIGNRLASLGGLISFFASSFLFLFRGIFKAEEKIRKFSFNNKIIEIRVKKKD